MIKYFKNLWQLLLEYWNQHFWFQIVAWLIILSLTGIQLGFTLYGVLSFAKYLYEKYKSGDLPGLRAVITWPYPNRNARLFFKEFSFELPSDLEERLQNASAVDKRLTSLAVAFEVACRFQSACQETHYMTVLKPDVEVLVAKRKRAFWKAHKLAKEAGFKVYPSYKAYLPPVPQNSAMWPTRGNEYY